jgi:hypothetical protein
MADQTTRIPGTELLQRLKDMGDGTYAPVATGLNAGKFTHLTAATGAVANRFVASTNMKVGAYVVANAGAMPTSGARHVTVTHTSNGTTDTLGTITVVGLDLAGNAISEDIVPVADGVATGTKWFASVTSVTGAGWVIAVGNDTLTVGCAAGIIAVEGSGVLQSVSINTTAAGAITLADSTGTIAILKASLSEGNYVYNVSFADYLSISQAAASDATYIHTP